MDSLKELLGTRKQIKTKKPTFFRQDSHKKKRLHKKWIKPKGLQSKMRLKRKGRSRSVSQGYRSPREVRHLHKSGLKIKTVNSIKDLENADSTKECIIISSAVGNRKKIILLKKSQEKGLKVINFVSAEDHITKIEDNIAERKKAKRVEEEKKNKVKVEPKKDKKSEGIQETDKKEIEKKEKDKVLIQKGK